MFDFVPKIVFYTPSDVSFHIRSTNYGFAYLTGFIWVSGTTKSVGGAYYPDGYSSSPARVYNHFNLVGKTLQFYGERDNEVNKTNQIYYYIAL